MQGTQTVGIYCACRAVTVCVPQTQRFVLYLVDGPLGFPMGANRAGKVANCGGEDV